MPTDEDGFVAHGLAGVLDELVDDFGEIGSSHFRHDIAAFVEDDTWADFWNPSQAAVTRHVGGGSSGDTNYVSTTLSFFWALFFAAAFGTLPKRTRTSPSSVSQRWTRASYPPPLATSTLTVI